MSNDPFEQTQTRFHDVIRDRRRFPRVILDRRAQVLRADGADPVPVTVHDVSPDGLQIRCGRARAALIHPSATSVREGEEPRILEVVMTLPLRAGPVPVRLIGQMIYFALINLRVVAIGVQFGALSQATRRTLERFIEESLEPAEFVERGAAR